jgi:5'-3' exonuclease
MGIPGLYGYFLSREVKEAIFEGIPPLVSSLSFDLNGVFHDARKQVFGEGDKDYRILQAIANTDPLQLELEIQNAIAAIILKMVQAANPRDCLILAVDGVAPGAKRQQQRGRRERAAKEKSPIESFDRNAITPGTEFMIRLDNFMLRFIGTYRQYLPHKVIYSSHLVPGEGEHKIMDYYRRGEVSDGPAAKEGGVHMLYGLDADLIMLSLMSPINNIFLSRETVREVVSIDVMRQYLMDLGQRPSSVDDFVVMMFLIGNDFLPHTPALVEMSESITELLNIYASGDYILTRETIDGRHEINWDSMKIFMQAVAARENDLLSSLSTKEFKYPSRFFQAALIGRNFYPDVFRSKWYQNALGAKGPADFTSSLEQIISNYNPNLDTELAQYRYRESGIPTNEDFVLITNISKVTPERIENMAIDYMRTMSWTYLYYREGTNAINLNWAYLYYHTPMLSDLSAVMQAVGTDFVISGFEKYEGMTSFTALHQLVAVLPMKSKELLPIELQPLFSYNSIIRDFFPDDFIIEMDGKNKDHEGTPIVPLIDGQRVIDAVAQINFTYDRAALWMPAVEQLFIRTEEETQRLNRIQFEHNRQENYLNRQAAQHARRQQIGQTQQIRRGQPQQIGRGQTQQIGRGRQTGQTPYTQRQQFGKSQYIQGKEESGQAIRGRGGKTVQRGRGRAHGPMQGNIQRPPTILPQNINVPTLTQPVQIQTTQRIQTTPQNLPKGPSLTPIGTTLPLGLRVGKGPALAPITPIVPAELTIKQGTLSHNIQVSPAMIQQPVQTTTRSPAMIQQPVQTTTRSPAMIQQPVQTVRHIQPASKSPARWKERQNLM